MRRSYLFLGLAFVSGCGLIHRTSPPPAQHIELSFSAYSGNALSGATTRPVNLADGLQVHTTLLALPTDPGLVLKPLSASSRLFAQPGAGEAVVATPSLTSAVRFGDDDTARDLFNSLQEPDAHKHVGVVTSAGLLSDGVTLAFRATDGKKPVEVRLQRRSADAVDLLLVTSRPAPASGDDAAASEMTLVEALPVRTDHPLVLIVPADWKSAGVTCLAARFDFSLPSSDPSTEEVRAQTAQLLELSRAETAALPTSLPVKNDAWSGYDLVMRSGEAGEKRRAAMNFVAGQTGATLAHDLILVVDSPTLEALHKSVLESMPGMNKQGVLLGWLMDYAAIRLCAERAAAGPLSPEMTSVLTMHLGEPARNPASLGDLINGVSSREELQTRVLVENMIYLEDSSPAARVRAFDFLSARGKAPAGYNPLGTPRERRDALGRATTSEPQP